MEKFSHDIKLTDVNKQRLLKELIANKYHVSLTSKQLINNEPIPTSLAQTRLWFLSKLEGNSATYNIPCVLQIKGTLDVAALIATIKRIVQRHAVLRTKFIDIGGLPKQVIISDCVIDLPVVKTTIDEFESLAIKEGSTPFDLTVAPLFRIKLLQINSEHHILLFIMHHIISDGWSISILTKEFGIFYNAIVNKQMPILPELKIQYSDYSQWQQKWLHGPDIQKQIEYWRNQLNDIPTLLQLPSDKVRPAVQSYKGESIHFTIPNKTLLGLKEISNKEKSTLYMVLLTAFKILLYRYTGQEDIVIGSPIANRTHQDLENLIGFFVNTLVLRTKIKPHFNFKQLLSLVKQTTLQAYDNQDVPFDQIVEVLQPERSLGHTPLFQVEFVLQNTPVNHFNLQQLYVEPVILKSSIAKFDMTLSLQEIEHEITGIWEYNTDLFEQATIKRMISHYLKLLENIITSTDKEICRLNLLSPAECNLQLIEWNKSPHQITLTKLAHQIFHEQASTTPDSIAVTHNSTQLTYRQLDEMSNQLAHFLREKGVGIDNHIAVYINRGISYLIAILGILKAGAAFVPLNPETGNERNTEILQHCEPSCVLIDSKVNFQEIAVSNKFSFYSIDEIDFTRLSSDFPNIDLPMNALAYLIYTSGSTGKPKGVMIEHRGMVNHLLSKIIDLNINEHDVIGQIAVQTFDVSIWQFLCPLLIGGRVAIVTGNDAWEPKSLFKRMQEEKITIIESVPSHTDILLNELEKNKNQYDLSHFKLYVSNAEPMPTEQAIRWFSLNTNIQLVNTFGTTECSDDTSHLHILPTEKFSTPYVSTHGVLPNMKLYVLDDLLNPVPIGVHGEVCIGGVGVGRGYYKDPERTSKVFIADPYSKDAFDKLYKTGDLARFHPDGTLEFIGRKDFQIKIRGFRVETGEIEVILQNHPNITRALVVADQDYKGSNYLIAYIISKIHPSPTIDQLTQYCNQYLPNYMVPMYFIFLDEFPLLDNGKINRKKLPKSYEQEQNQLENYVAPTTQLEIDIAVQWQRVLNLTKVGLEDNFFQIGGHSLAAVELVAVMSEIIGSDISVRDLFEKPTIKLLLQNHVIK